jgi:hypothetical protein
MIGASWSRHIKDEANRGAQPMHRNRRPQSAIALLSLVSLMAALALAFVQNVELGMGVDDGLALMGIEGEGDLPLPAEQT